MHKNLMKNNLKFIKKFEISKKSNFLKMFLIMFKTSTLNKYWLLGSRKYFVIKKYDSRKGDEKIDLKSLKKELKKYLKIYKSNTAISKCSEILKML